MFDLNVTFSTDSRLTYAAVLENLHILDYDYYFKVTDALSAGSISKSLVLFDEILRKGFDGHLFVVGLLEHFRNLLVCKDAITVSLLQVSESAERKYLEQSRNADMSFLLSALSITSQCDIHYKAAKNQRLHVELCLMKLANLPNVLQLNSLAAVDETAKKKVEPELKTPHTDTSITTEVKSIAPEPVASVAVRTAPATETSPVKPTRLKSTQLIPSLPVAYQPAQESVKVPADTIVNSNPPKTVLEELTLEKLQMAWYEFAERRRQQYNSTTEEITLRKEFKLADNIIEIVLDNDHQLDAIQSMRYDLLGFLKSRFNVAKLEINARVAPQEVNRMPYTPAEKFNYMAEKNPHLLNLKQALGLDVDF